MPDHAGAHHTGQHHHIGRRRKQSVWPIARLLVLVIAVVAVGWLVLLPEPSRGPASVPGPLAVVPTWAGPTPVSILARLADGAAYQPRLYITPQISVGVAESPDRTSLRVVLRTAGGPTTELRRVALSVLPQFDGFVASGDTLVWAESVSQAGQAVRTTLWRSNWRTRTKPTEITANTGEANFFGGQYDMLVRSNRVYWAALGTGSAASTEIRSVPLQGGQVAVSRVQGAYGLSAWPWAVSQGGLGTPVVLLNLNDSARITVDTSPAETAVCSPKWCRMGVLGGNAVVRFDVQRPDGSERRRIAGDEATPSLVDVALLDRYVPLTTDRGEDGTRVGVGLSLYDITTGRTELVAADVAGVQGRGTMLWWSTGTGEELAWHCIDLRALS